MCWGIILYKKTMFSHAQTYNGLTRQWLHLWNKEHRNINFGTTGLIVGNYYWLTCICHVVFTSGGSLYMVLCVCLLLIYFDVSTFICLWLVRNEWLWLDEISGRMCTDVQYALLYRLYCLYASQLLSVNTRTMASLILTIVGGTSPSKVLSRLAIIYLIYLFCCRIKHMITKFFFN